MKNWTEISGDDKCSCGSGKKYKNCCQKKKFQYGYEDHTLSRKVPFQEDFIPVLQQLEDLFQEYYGRCQEEEEYVLPFIPIYNDEVLLQSVYLFKKLHLPENIIYAYYKSDGLFPCDLNIDLLPEVEREEFANLCSEYDDFMNEPVGGSINAVQFVVLSNSFIQERLHDVLGAIIATLNDFIRRYCKSNAIYEYEMKTELDYLLFSALKTIKTLRSVEKLMEEHLPECIYALGRGIFGNYIYLSHMNRDTSLFQKKLLPKVDNKNYEFDKTREGKINYNKVIDKKPEKNRRLAFL